MKSDKKITKLQLLLFISSIVAINFVYPMEQQNLSIMSDLHNNEISIESKDPQTSIQVQYGTKEYCSSSSKYYVTQTTVAMKQRLSSYKNCLVEKKTDKSSLITFYETYSQAKKEISAYDFDEFTIYPTENGVIVIKRKNELLHLPEQEVLRFTLS